LWVRERPGRWREILLYSRMFKKVSGKTRISRR
jgi:hypothetical protein